MLQTYRYKAKNPQGEILTGYVQAASQDAAVKVLGKNSLAPIEVSLPKNIIDYLPINRKISLRDKSILARQLATMVNAGLPLVQAISILLKQTRHKKLRSTLESILLDLEGGYAFSTALSKFPETFNRVFINVVRAGEATGQLETVLLQLADNLEKDKSLTNKIKGALFYPAFILIAMIGVGVLMMVKVIPTLKSIFEAAGSQLPISTRMVIATSDFMIHRWYVVILVIIFLIIGSRVFTSSPKGLEIIARMQINLPFIKLVSREAIMGQFARTLSMLVGSGVPLLEAIKIVADAINNVIYRQDILLIAHDVERGVPMSVPISKNRDFPILVGQMVAVGEQTGKLSEILEKLASYYESETEERVKGVSSLIEPLVMIVIGIGVAVLVFAVMVPIYQISQLEG